MVFTAAAKLGLDKEAILRGLASFKGVARRMQKIGQTEDNKVVYDDFAHHPTALKKVIDATRARFTFERLVVFLQLSNFTQKEGVMWQRLQEASVGADLVLLLQNNTQFPYQAFAQTHEKPVMLIPEIFTKEDVRQYIRPGDHVLTCSSRDCSVVHEAVLQS
jgi:UDP-N-acetylmuramate: L-alanyl-gamma-D-glutamyl-meso-diaminopimelate ligase